MKIIKIILLLTLLIGIPCTGIANSKTDKTILIPVEEYPALNIENLYVSPHFPGEDQPPLIAFYGEDERHIFLYNPERKKITRFVLKLAASSWDTTSVSFVTFCWDQKNYGEFAVIFSKKGQRLGFHGQINGGTQLKNPEKLDVNTIGFNYWDGDIYYVKLKENAAKIPRTSFWQLSSPWSQPDQPQQVISDFKLMPRIGKPYFVLRNVKTNDNGIYDEKFNPIVDTEKYDELYPHYSGDGKLLGYIERDKRTASARICLKGKNTLKSTFSFALDENALLREYQRMYFLENQLYFFKKEPDLHSKNEKYGFFKLSEQGPINLVYESEMVTPGDQVLDILTGEKGKCHKITTVPTVKDIIPIKYKGQLYFVVLTNPGKYTIHFNQKKGGLNFRKVKGGQAILIVNPDFVKEVK
jgi:hypothetical protein